MERIDKTEALCPFSGGAWACTWRCPVAVQRVLLADGRPVEKRWMCGVAAGSAAAGLGYAPSYMAEDVVA